MRSDLLCGCHTARAPASHACEETQCSPGLHCNPQHSLELPTQWITASLVALRNKSRSGVKVADEVTSRRSGPSPDVNGAGAVGRATNLPVELGTGKVTGAQGEFCTSCRGALLPRGDGRWRRGAQRRRRASLGLAGTFQRCWGILHGRPTICPWHWAMGTLTGAQDEACTLLSDEAHGCHVVTTGGDAERRGGDARAFVVAFARACSTVEAGSGCAPGEAIHATALVSMDTERTMPCTRGLCGFDECTLTAELHTVNTGFVGMETRRFTRKAMPARCARL